MINVGAFCDWGKTELDGVELVIPSGVIRHAYPYISVTEIVTNHPRTHQVGKEQLESGAMRTTFQERLQLSLTAIGKAGNDASKALCQSLRDLLYGQERKDFFSEQGWKFKMVSFPTARYLTSDNFGEERHGFDIEISKTYTIDDDTAGEIDEVIITDSGGKLSPIVAETES